MVGKTYSIVIYGKILLICLLFCFTSCKTESHLTYSENKANILKYADKLTIWKDGDTYFAETRSDSTNVLGLYIFPAIDDKRDYIKDYPKAIIITKESDNYLLYSSVYSSVLEELSAGSKIGSVVDASYFKSNFIKDGIASGRITDMGTAQQLSTEKLIASKPTLAITTVYDGMNISTIQQKGIPIVYMTDNLETTPLGRAEWIKFIGLLSGDYEKADSIFHSVENNYNSMKSAVSKESDLPKVMVENMYQGVWYVPAGDSYAAELLADAGGDYLWKNDKGVGSLSLSFEQILHRASDADIWLLKLYGTELTADILKGEDERNMLFGPVGKHGVWYSNTAVTNLFDEFPFHPDLLLKDYISIFHPEMFPDFTPRYFKHMTY